MISLKTKETKSSTTAGFEGVTFTVRRLSKIQRSARDLSILTHRLRFYDLLDEIRENTPEHFHEHADAVKIAIGLIAACAPQEEIDAAKAEVTRLSDLVKDTPEMKRKREYLDHEAGLVWNQYVVPGILRAGVSDISGLQNDYGAPVTVEDLISSASPEANELIDEIVAECEKASGLTAEQKKN